MNLEELLVLLPCHGLEDFPQHYRGEEAEGLLAAWTALWHPSLLSAAGNAPRWCRADDPPGHLAGRLVVIPAVSGPLIPDGFVEQAKAAGACLISNEIRREVILERAFADTGIDRSLDTERAADFLALGYAYLQTQLLTRQMRYSSTLDERHFFNQLLAGAEAAQQARDGDARDKLAACFDLLAEQRDHYYSVDAYLLDITLLAPQTLGKVQQELAAVAPVNLLLSGHLLEKLAVEQPQTLAILRERLAAGTLGLIGGEYEEEPLPLHDLETVRRQLERGRAAYRQWLGRDVVVFGRWRFGLTPMLPQVLERSGFQGALHLPLEEGRLPESTQSKSRWQGCDGSTIDVLAKAPLDAARPETFLRLAHRLGESMDMDHVATLCLAHWPAKASPWYDDLRRCAAYGAALGKLVTVEEYFRETYLPGHLDRFDADSYRTPYLKQAVRRGMVNPLSTCVEDWQRHAAQQVGTGLHLLIACLRTGSPPDRTPDVEERHGVEACTGPAAQLAELGLELAATLPRADAPPEDGVLVINGASFARRVPIEIAAPAGGVAAEPLRCGDPGGAECVLVDVPAMGFTWLTAGRPRAASGSTDPLLGEEIRRRDGGILLRNEFFQARVGTSGALVSLGDYASRGARLSQQVALRVPRRASGGLTPGANPAEQAEYSVMAAEQVALTRATSTVGEVTVRGRLLDQQGQHRADFQQQFRVWRGRRVLELEVELQPREELSPDPWNHYYACRFAWADETAQLLRSVQQTRQPTAALRGEAPLFLEIATEDQRTSILTGGLPYFRRSGERMLDLLLIVSGERQRRFRIGIGIDLPNPLHEAMQMLSPCVAVAQRAPPPTPARTGWLFHLDNRSVLSTHWEPLLADGLIVGTRLRLLECLGRTTRTRLACFRPLRSARRTDFLGNPLGDLPLDEGRALLELAGYEWGQFEVCWENSPGQEMEGNGR